MPPLRLLGHRWFIASDECSVIAATSACIELLFAGMSLLMERLDFWDHTDAQLPLGFCAIAFCAAAVIDLLVVCVSARGACWDEQRRRCLPCILCVRAVMELPKVVGVALMCVKGELFAPSTFKKLNYFVDVLRLAILWAFLFAQLVDVCVRVLGFLLMGPRSTSCPELDEPLLLKPSSVVFRLMGRAVGSTGQEKFIIKLLEDYMQGFDWTVGDLMAGTVLLQGAQRVSRKREKHPQFAELGLEGTKWTRREERQLQCSCGGAMLELSPVEEEDVLKDVLHQLGFATAAYGWAVDLIFPRNKSRDACWQRAANLTSFDTAKHHQGNAEAALELLESWPGHKDSRLVFYSPEVGVNCARFAIFADMSEKNVVVAVRGTLSVSDAMTDLCATPEELPTSAITGPGVGHFVHRGMWEGAQFIFDALKKTSVLQKLKVLDEFAEDVDRSQPTWLLGHEFSFDSDFQDSLIGGLLPDCTGFGLVVVGHSLGGGVATYLKAMLAPHAPEVRCVVFGAPPVFSETMSRQHCERMMYVVCGDDLVARLSLRNMEFLRDRMVSLLARCLSTKFCILVSGFLHSAFHYERRLFRLVDKIEPGTAKLAAMKSLGSFEKRQLHPPTFHSGRMIYLRIDPGPQRCFGWCPSTPPKYAAEWAETVAVQEVLLGADALLHHFPYWYKAAVEGSLASLVRCRANGGVSAWDTLLREGAEANHYVGSTRSKLPLPSQVRSQPSSAHESVCSFVEVGNLGHGASEVELAKIT